MFVLEDIFEVDNLVGVVADGEHRDLVEDLHGAVHAAAVPGAELGCVRDPGLAVGAFTHGGKKAAGKKHGERERNM